MASIAKLFRNILGGAALIALSAVAQAAPITFNYEGSVNKVLEFTVLDAIKAGFGLSTGSNTRLLLQHDLLGGSWTDGESASTSYDPATDTLASLDLTLNFTGTNPLANLFGTWKGISFDTSFGNASEVQGSSTEKTVALGIDLTGYDISDLSSEDGFFDLLLSLNELGKVKLASYSLTISGIRTLQENATPVPVPSTLALLSLGLVGAGFFSRRRGKAANC